MTATTTPTTNTTPSTPPTTPVGPNEFKRGWLIILVSAIGVGCGLTAMPFYTFGAFIAPLQGEFGWSRGEIQTVITLFTLTTFITLPLCGKVLDKVGPRKVALLSQFAFVVTFGSLALVPDNLVLFYAMWMVMAVTSIGTTAITYSYVVNTWFNRHRGIALGLTLSGTGFAATLGPSYAAWLIETFGWRAGYPGMAAISLFVSIPLLLLFLKDQPEEDSKPAELRTTPDVPIDVPGLAPRDAVKGYKFWVIGIGMFGVSAGTGGVIPSLIPLLGDSGYSMSDAAAYAGLIGLMVITGRVLVGIMLDFIWAPLVAFLFFAPSAIACFLLVQNDIGSASIIISVLLLGLCAGAEFDIIAYLVSRYFGMKHYGTIYSWVYLIFISATAAAPFLYGTAYDAFGSYDLPLIVTGVLIIITTLPLFTLGPVPKEYGHEAKG